MWPASFFFRLPPIQRSGELVVASRCWTRLAAVPAAAQEIDPIVFDLAFAAPGGGAMGTGTLTVPVSGNGITLSVEQVDVGPLSPGDFWFDFARDVGSVAGDDTSCPIDEDLLLNGAMDRPLGGAFFDGSETLSGLLDLNRLRGGPTDRRRRSTPHQRRREALRWMALGAEFICGRGAYGRPCPSA